MRTESHDFRANLLRTDLASQFSMPRTPRVFIPHTSVHVIQRGNNRTEIFRAEEHFRVFLTFLRNSAVRRRVVVHAYVLMTTHFHLIVTPTESPALSLMMKELGERYVKYFNREAERSGTLWNGRYRSLVIGDERYWLTCLRYVEQNPVRARMVQVPGDYRWSSYGAHAFGRWEDW